MPNKTSGMGSGAQSPEIYELRAEIERRHAEIEQLRSDREYLLGNQRDQLARADSLIAEIERLKEGWHQSEQARIAGIDEIERLEREWAEDRQSRQNAHTALMTELERLRAALAGLLDVDNLTGEDFDRRVANARRLLGRHHPACSGSGDRDEGGCICEELEREHFEPHTAS